jgi:tetratricopeptide (TPR) repeat protein
MMRYRALSKNKERKMPSAQEKFDDAMFAFSAADYGAAIAQLKALLAEHPEHFDARLALGMAYYRQGDYVQAIAEGLKAEQLQPREQLVHTNLSLFYMKSGDKQKAEHHGLQARIASWREQSPAPSSASPAGDPELGLAQPAPAPMKFTGKLPDMPWKKKAGPPPDSPPKADPGQNSDDPPASSS